MSNGRHALKGFEYQTTVILDLILKHFNNSSESIVIKPEDKDDLVITSINGNNIYYQVKKPKEFDNEVLKNEPWSLIEIINILLPGTFDRLSCNKHEQTWILGDDLKPECYDLLKERKDSKYYLSSLHIFARNRSKILSECKEKRNKNQLMSWKPSSGLELSSVILEYTKKAKELGIPDKSCQNYESTINDIHKNLTDVLNRISVKPNYGSDGIIRDRIQNELAHKYNLNWEVSKNTLIPCLRNYIYNVSTELGTTISRDNFELEIRNIWPKMTMICEPPERGTNFIYRDKLIHEVLSRNQQGPLEVTGISGSGKTALSSDIFHHFKKKEVDLKPIYVEVRPDRTFEDVIAGISFKIRSFGISNLFTIATNYNYSYEKKIIEIAEEINSSSLKIQIIIDLVQGSCSDIFANEIAKFVKLLNNKEFRIIVFGQESSLRMLTELERVSFGYPETIDMPGISFEEFEDLAKVFHSSNLSKSNLLDLYQQLTSNRSSGLNIMLANAIIRCDSYEKMKKSVNLLPEKMLQEADLKRYNTIADDLKNVTDKLLCFFLPFRIDEVENLFPENRIKEAIRELVKKGLLRTLDFERFEFHETVRKGLAEFIPINISNNIHKILSGHYMKSGNITAAIFHLEMSGQKEEARNIAHLSFAKGEFRVELLEYVKKEKLFSAPEIIDMLLKGPIANEIYMLPQMLNGIGNTNNADHLIQIINKNIDIFIKDFNWFWRISEAIVTCDTNKLFELVNFALKVETEHDLIKVIFIGVKNLSNIKICTRLINLFNDQDEETKLRLIPLFLIDKRKEVLKLIFSFLDKSININPSILNSLKILTIDDINEFLAAFPKITDQINYMILYKSVLLGKLEPFIWKERNTIRPLCIEILERETSNEYVLINSLRVLIFLQDEYPLNFISKKEGKLRNFSSFIPFFYSHKIDPKNYRSIALNSDEPIDKRIMAFYYFCSSGGNIDLFINDLYLIETDKIGLWEQIIFTSSLQYSFRSIIPIIDKKIRDFQPKLLAVSILNLNELSDDCVTDFYVRMLESTNSEISKTTCLCLTQRRTQRALPAIVKYCQNQQESKLIQPAIVAAISCGLKDIGLLKRTWSKFPSTFVWKCILIGRLKDESQAEWIVSVATDISQHWQVRRAAILAASRLPYNIALKRIYLLVLKEQTSFLIDKHSGLYMHEILAPLIFENGPMLLKLYRRGKKEFIEFWGELLRKLSEGNIYPVEEDMGEKSAQWLFDRLTYHNCLHNKDAQDKILNEIHIPIIQAAVLRGLRMAGQMKLLQNLLKDADSEWFQIRIICELARCQKYSKEEVRYIKGLVKSDSIRVNRCLELISTPQKKDLNKKLKEENINRHKFTNLFYEDIIKGLKTGSLQGDAPYLIHDLSKDQFSYLIKELDPKNDNEIITIFSEPSMHFNTFGPILVNKKEYIEKNRKLRETLRPAIVSVNKFGIFISWHKKYLSGELQFEYKINKYCSDFLISIGINQNSDLLYEELEKYPEVLIPVLSNNTTLEPIKNIIDNRIIHFLSIHSHSGDDQILCSICRLALLICSEKIDSILNELFSRWYHIFKERNTKINFMNQSLGKAFNILKEHPRFKNILNLDLRLMEIVHSLDRNDRLTVVRILSNSRKSYSTIEALLMKTASFEHYLFDETDKLDEIAQELFD